MKYTSTKEHIIALHEQGKNHEEILHEISIEWEIEDRIRIVYLIEYALEGEIR